MPVVQRKKSGLKVIGLHWPRFSTAIVQPRPTRRLPPPPHLRLQPRHPPPQPPEAVAD